MKKFVAIVILAFVVPSLLLGQGTTRKQSAKQYPGKTWEKVKSPEDIGWSLEKLKLARKYSEEISSAGVMIVADGIVLDEWGETTRRFNVHSIRKSF